MPSRGQTQSTLVKLGNLVKIYLFPSDTKVFPCGISLHPVIISGKMTCEKKKKTKKKKQKKKQSLVRIIFSSRTVQPKSACNLITWQKKHLFLQGSSQRQLLSRAEYAIYMIYMIQILCFNIYVDLFLMIFVCYQRN